jgi:hypothetical protein
VALVDLGVDVARVLLLRHGGLQQLHALLDVVTVAAALYRGRGGRSVRSAAAK